MFQWWIADEFGLPDAEHIRFGHGLDELDDATGAADTIREIHAGAAVCQDVQLFWWADSAMEVARDAKHVGESLGVYFSTRSVSER